MHFKQSDSLIKKNLLSRNDFKVDILLELTRDAIRRARKFEMDKYGTHPRRYALLLVLQEMGDTATPAKLSRRLHRKRHSVSELLSKMKKDGLIIKKKDLAQKNRVRVILTPKGKKVTELASQRESLHKIFSSLSKQEVRRTKDLLEKIRDNLLAEHGLERSVPQFETYDMDYISYLLMVETTDEINKLRQKGLKPFGIHHRRAALLLVLKDLGEKATSADIAGRLCRERNSVSELLTKMERDGLIKKLHDPGKKNVVHFLLTDKGRKAYEHSSKQGPVNRLISKLSKDEQKELSSNLLVLYDSALKEVDIHK